MILLYKDLAQKDAKKLVEELNRRNIKYELEPTPTIGLYVPRDQKEHLWRNLPQWSNKTK